MSKVSAFRAVDNQVYVSMCSPARDMNAGYHAVSIPVLEDVTFNDGLTQWGHSMVVNPM
jgi:omega-amidase